MRKLAWMSTGLAFAALAAFAAAAGGRATLSAEELRALFSANTLVLLEPADPAATFVQRELFRPDGSVVAYADRAEIPGRYELRGDAVCVVTGHRPGCRRFIRRGPDLYEEQREGSAARLVSVRPAARH